MIEDVRKAMSLLPAYLQTPERNLPFPETVMYVPRLSGAVVKDQACNLPYTLVRKLPRDSALGFTVDVNGDRYPFQLIKGESRAFIETIRLISTRDERFRLEAAIHRQDILIAFLKGTVLEDEIKSNHRVLHYDLTARINGQTFPPLHATPFLRWAYKAFSYFNPTHIMAQWEPDSVNHKAFYDALTANGENVLEAAQQTWTHRRFTELGFKLIPKVDIQEALNQKKSPLGYPSTVIQLLYKK